MKIAGIVMLVLLECSTGSQSGLGEQKAPGRSGKDTTVVVPDGAAKLIKAYPDIIEKYSNNHLVFKNRKQFIWDDGIHSKSIADAIEHPDLEEMFLQPYPKMQSTISPAKNVDPGRIRNVDFFMSMYGNTENEVRKNLVEITWCPKLVSQKILITKVNGVDKKLIRISAELDKHPEWKKYLTNIGGTFVWRNISGTDRTSMHSFGMTVDINVKYSDYWQWACDCTNENATVKYVNKIPEGIVKIFEENGFIWGGRWYHFDTMHFEYRPELM